MVKKFVAVSALLLSTASAYAGCIGSVVGGQCAGVTVNSPFVGTNVNSDSGYQGSSGSSYQYDLSNPTDASRYSTDLGAQRRDAQSLDMGRTLDRGLGQYGGGILSE